MRQLGYLALLLAVGMTACGGKIIEEPEQLEVEPAPEPVASATTNDLVNPFHDGDDWRGSYTCPQGLTQLDLQIVATAGDAIDDALFVFDWTGGPANGSFHMKGSFDPSTGTATFTPGAWIDDPGPDWWTVAMSGQANATTYAGEINSAGCGSFSLTKQ